ncbi:MAG: hypothetical protein JRE64_25210 [Deltaproteobacteria bacterium]|nr:hypothetical protein [Deltaproteobacteria bacterium]
MGTLIERQFMLSGGGHLSERKIPEDFWQRGAAQLQLQHVEMLQRNEFANKISALEEKIRRIEKATVGYIKINLLPTKRLRTPLDAIVEQDDDGFIARITDVPLYGYGDDPVEAIDALKCEIESLYDDLMEDDDFTEEWLTIKDFLKKQIIA